MGLLFSLSLSVFCRVHNKEEKKNPPVDRGLSQNELAIQLTPPRHGTVPLPPRAPGILSQRRPDIARFGFWSSRTQCVTIYLLYAILIYGWMGVAKRSLRHRSHDPASHGQSTPSPRATKRAALHCIALHRLTYLTFGGRHSQLPHPIPSCDLLRCHDGRDKSTSAELPLSDHPTLLSSFMPHTPSVCQRARGCRDLFSFSFFFQGGLARLGHGMHPILLLPQVVHGQMQGHCSRPREKKKATPPDRHSSVAQQSI